jgi:class 3 adenylate cyclase
LFVNCPSCGSENPEAARFCGDCGQSLSAARPCEHCGFANAPDVRFCWGCGTPIAGAPPAAPSSVPTAVASGRYRIERFLGEGGRKRVYLARDARLERQVAIALLKIHGLDPQGLLRLRREALAMARLGDHPNVVTVYDVGEESGQPYIVTQYIPGGSVDDLLTVAEGRRLGIPDCLRLMEQVCRGLAYAHRQGIVHRDLKPKNVWLTDDGTAKIGDFGLAVAGDRNRLTVEGMMVGTAHYMPPEQAVGGEVDARSDLYSLGAMLYEMLCGRPPFLGDDAVAVVSQHINTAPVAPSWHNPFVPRPLEELVLRLLAKSPDQRPATAEEVAEGLTAISMVSSGITPAHPDQPNPLERLAGGVFVGRQREMEELRHALDETLAGRGRLILLVGESGIGKSRLAAELTTYATLRGAQVLSGRCYEGEGAPAYWPWLQIMRAYVRDRDAEALVSEMGTGAAEIAQLVTEVRERVPSLAPATLAVSLDEPGQSRFRLFDSITTFLKNAAATRPLMLILDDLHWADAPSLQLLQFLARELAGCRLLVVGTYRDEEVTRQHPLSQALGELAREHLSERILLRGLSAVDVARFIERTASIEPPAALTATVHRATEGNPFFLNEVVHLLASEGRFERPDEVTSWSVEIPEGVREAVGRRLDHLSQECNELLSNASAIGQEFSLDVLERVAGRDRNDVLGCMEEALTSRIIAEVSQAVGRYRFSHTLVRETLYGELGITRRVQLHHRIGEVLEAVHAGNLEPHLAELAYHFFQASLAGDTGKAIEYSIRAGERALRILAFEEATQLFERTLQLLELTDPGNETRRYDVQMLLGEAWARVGDMNRAKDVFRDAIVAARKLGDPEKLSHAGLWFGRELEGLGFEMGYVEETANLLEEALEALPAEDSAIRAMIMGRIAVSEYWLGNRNRRESLAREALAMAERVGDTAALASALHGVRYALWSPENAEERLATSMRALQVAAASGHKDRMLQAHRWLVGDLLELGRADEADREIETHNRIASELRQPIYQWYAEMFNAMRAIMVGRFTEGEETARRALEIGQRAGSRQALNFFGAQMSRVWYEQGKLHDMLPLMQQAGDVVPPHMLPIIRAAYAFYASELGRMEDARAAFEELARDDFASLPRIMVFLHMVVFLSQACATLGDAKRAAVLYDLLAPFAGRAVIDGPPAAVCNGPASHYLGLLAATMGKHDLAMRHFEESLRMGESMRAPPFVAHTQYAYAGVLLAKGEHGRALELATQALATARELGMASLVERALALKLAAQGVGADGLTSSIGAVTELVAAERPDLSMHASPEGTVTILFTDIEDYSGMTERLGDLGVQEVLRSHHAIVRDSVVAHDGAIVKSSGDGFMAVFAQPQRAVQCSIAIQRALAGLETPEPIRVRIGLHVGEAIKEFDDFYGRNVIVAARIAGSARGGQILVSSSIRDAAASASDLQFGDERAVELRGLRGSHTVYELAWR